MFLFDFNKYVIYLTQIKNKLQLLASLKVEFAKNVWNKKLLQISMTVESNFYFFPCGTPMFALVVRFNVWPRSAPAPLENGPLILRSSSSLSSYTFSSPAGLYNNRHPPNGELARKTFS